MNEEVKEKRNIEVVTGATLAAYQEQKMGLSEPVVQEVKEEPKEEIKAEPEVKAEIVESKVETDKEEKENENVKNKVGDRIHELAEKAKSEKTRREELEREVNELKAKLNPKPVEQTDFDKTKPKKEEFTDAFDYAEKLSEWNVKKALHERDQAEAKARIEAAQNQRLSTWTERLEAAKTEAKEQGFDYIEKIEKANIALGDEVKEAIMDSELGPKILLHLADNPSEADKINKMTVGKAYIYLGKIEATLSKSEAKVEIKEEKKAEPKVEVSKAPPPISPLKGASSPPELPIDSRGEWKGTHEQYKEARRSGKIQ